MPIFAKSWRKEELSWWLDTLYANAFTVPNPAGIFHLVNI